MDDGFSELLFFETINCPKCGQIVTRDEVEENLSDDQESFVCPYCGKETDIDELE